MRIFATSVGLVSTFFFGFRKCKTILLNWNLTFHWCKVYRLEVRFLDSCRCYKFQNHEFYKFYYFKPRILYKQPLLFSRIIYSTDVQCPDIDPEALEKSINDNCNFEIDSTSILDLPDDSLIPNQGCSWNPSKEIAYT